MKSLLLVRLKFWLSSEPVLRYQNPEHQPRQAGERGRGAPGAGLWRWLVVGVFLTSCTSGPSGPSHSVGTYKLGKPYYVNGVRYVPRFEPDYNRTGIASWYGEKFHGRKTANGEIFNMNALSAAHPTLPLPAKVRVTNLENGRSLVLRVNDRGPFANGRIIDVSKRAAKELGFLRQGTAKVRVEYIGPAPLEVFYAERPKTSRKERNAGIAAPRISVASTVLPPLPGVAEARSDASSEATGSVPLPKPLAGTPERAVPVASMTPVQPAAGALYIQAGAFLDPLNASRFRERLESFGTVKVRAEMIDGKQYYRIWLGPLQTVEAADRKLGELIAAGHTDARIVVE